MIKVITKSQYEKHKNYIFFVFKHHKQEPIGQPDNVVSQPTLT